MSKKFFKLYGNCIPVNGISESVIFDIERRCFLPITNNIFEFIIFNEEKNFSIDELKGYFNHQQDEGIDALFNYIQDKGYGFFTNEPELFPKISLEWDSPYIITNAIFEITIDSLPFIHNAIQQLNSIGCEAIELRFIDEFSYQVIADILTLFNNSRTKCIFLFIKYSDSLKFGNLKSFYINFSTISTIIVHSSIKNEDYKNLLPPNVYSKIKSIEKIINIENVETVNSVSMVLNMASFTEAYNYNLGLNRKVCINHKGEIKNYLSHNKTFGLIQVDNLREVIGNIEFQKKWNITKDNIEVCRDCQNRFFCMDTADIIQKEGKYYRKINCKFDPYKNTWN